MDYFNRIALALLASAIYVSFNDVTAQEVEVEEVVVTATRREESLQDVALSAQALTNEDLEAQQVTEMYDLGDLQPGITFAPTIGTGYFVGIRGSAVEAIGANSIGSVQTAINGHVVNTTIFGNLGFLDAERIEILAGPQGTLYGRNVTGGLLNVITARPTGDSSGYAKMQYGNLGQTRLSSAFNLPISDGVSARVAYGSYTQDGTVKNLELDTMIDDRDAEAARISLDIATGDRSVLQLTHEVQSFNDSRLSWANQYCSKDMLLGCDPTVKGDYNTGAHYAGTIGAAFGLLTFMQPSKLTDIYANSPTSDDLNETYQDYDPTRFQDSTFSTMEWIQTRDSGDLKVKYSYQTFEAEHTDDNDKGVSQVGFQTGLGLALGLAEFEAELEFQCLGPRVFSREQTIECSETEEERQQFEVNWISDLDGPMNYTLGMYTHKRAFFNDYHVQNTGYSMNRSFDQHPYSDSLFAGALDGFGGISFWQNLGGALSAGLPAVFAGQLTVNQLLASLTSTLIGADAAGLNLDGTANQFGPGYMRFTHPVKMGGLINSDHGKQISRSSFGEMYYQIDDVTKLTVGLRYDQNSPEYTAHNALGDANAAGARMGLCARANGGVWTRAGTACGISYGEQDETAVTGKLAIQRDISDDVMVYGLISTGNKPGGTSPNNAGDILPYAGTDSTNIELGLRSILAGGRVLLNATVFQTDFDDAHNSMIYGLSAITNTIDYTHTGLEIQSKFLLGDNTSLDINVFALDSEIGSDQAFYDPINPFGLTSNDQVNFARDEAGLAAIINQAITGSVSAGGLGAQIARGVAEGVGAAFPFCNFGLFASVGIIGKCQGVFLIDPAIQALPTMAQVDFQNVGGNRMPGTSDLDYNIALNHAIMTRAGAIDTRLTYAVKGGGYVDIFNTDRGEVDARTNFDLIANYSPNDGDWYVGLYGKNLADKRYVLSYDRGSEVQGGVLNATIAMPRTYGVSFGINF